MMGTEMAWDNESGEKNELVWERRQAAHGGQQSARRARLPKKMKKCHVRVPFYRIAVVKGEYFFYIVARSWKILVIVCV